MRFIRKVFATQILLSGKFSLFLTLGVSAGIWIIHTGPKSGGELVTLFGGYYYDGLIAAIGVQHRQVPNLGVSWSRFLAVTLMMV